MECTKAVTSKTYSSQAHQTLEIQCLCPPKIQLSPDIQCDDTWRWGLWEVMRSCSYSPQEWDQCPYKRDPT